MGAIHQVFGSFKDFGIGWLLLEATNAPEKDNERERVINHQ